MRRLILLVLFAQCACAAPPVDDGARAVSSSRGDSAQVANSAALGPTVGACRERTRKPAGRALHDLADFFALSRETRGAFAALLPDAMVRVIW